MVGCFLMTDGARRMGEWEFKEGADSAEALGPDVGACIAGTVALAA